jgi:hypothetical protein
LAVESQPGPFETDEVDFPERTRLAPFYRATRYRRGMQRSLMTTTPDISGVRLLP